MIWKQSLRYPKYEGSPEGLIRNGKTKLILKPRVSNSGYLTVNLYDENGKNHTVLVHRFVAEIFIPNPNNFPQINHLDENKLNNNILNLAWVTSQENMNYNNRYERAMNTRKAGSTKTRPMPVLQYSKNGIFIKEYPSITEAERQTGNHSSNICKALKGIYNTCGGYIWKYKEGLE